MEAPKQESLQAKIETHKGSLRELGFIDESGELTRQVITHAESFNDELDDRLSHKADYSSVGDLPEMFFLTDVAKPGEEAVYPFHGESNDMIYAVSHFFPGRKFASAIECFAGAGHGGIKLRHSQSLQSGASIHSVEINPRAIVLAEANAMINEAGILYHQADITKDGFSTLPKDANKPGETIYFGNAPFALTPPKSKLETCRDGGSDGLEKTMAFIMGSLAHGSCGDAIVGVAYSRINKSGQYELGNRLEALQTQGRPFNFRIELVQGAKLWRGHNGKKEQENPMDLDMMHVKAKEGSDMHNEYQSMAKEYKQEGWNRLGYVRYVIEISEPTRDVSIETNTQVESVLE